MRLPSIFLLLALVLLAGVVSVRVLESRMGGATVPGLVLVEVPGLSHDDLEQLRSRHAGAVLEAIVAPAAPLAPFDVARLTRLRDRGDRTALYTLASGEDGVQAPDLWTKRRTTFPAPELESLVGEAAAFLAAQASTRAFCLALVLPAAGAGDGAALLQSLVTAAAELPSFRRSSIVLLGSPRADALGQRWSLRLDLGRWPRGPEPSLRDLLEARW